MARLWLLLLALLSAAALADDLLDDRGWHSGTPAAGAAALTGARTPQPVTLPAIVADRVTRRTFLFYFSPTCGHCQAAAPEVVRLAAGEDLDLDVLGVASSNASPGQLEAFNKEFGVNFPVVVDAEREFATAVGARSTPTVIVVEPDGVGGLLATDAYYPWYVGAGAVLKMRLDPAAPFAHFKPGVYQGRVACSACHTQETEGWMLSHHSIAYGTLYTRERAGDLKCVGCHVTGLGEESGFQMGDHRSALAGVTCEACHSAGGPHDGQPGDAAAACVGCHDADHSVAFGYEKGLPHIDHYLANALSEGEVEQRLRDLAAGALERPLLAFPEGENLGAAACRDCHAGEHKSWKRSPHREAMDSLEKDGAAGDVECVRCHATPVSSGPAPAELAGYRIDEGVSCESCHGPGEAHAADPRTDNIVGLGETCPECVIEEICTSCHTPKWDPSWELKKRLKAAGH
jgi:thiol-disulfide isomerase/thioredoxin